MKYIVQRGDNLTKIAKKFGVTVNVIATTNGIKNKNLIYVGQVLQIPVKEEPVEKPVEKPVEPVEDKLRKAFNECLTAIKGLPEFKALEELLYG